MNPTRSRTLVAALLLTVASAATTGCNHELFVDHDRRTSTSLRYYDNDSATETTAARRQSAGMPFGLPQGSAAQ